MGANQHSEPTNLASVGASTPVPVEGEVRRHSYCSECIALGCPDGGEPCDCDCHGTTDMDVLVESFAAAISCPPRDVQWHRSQFHAAAISLSRRQRELEEQTDVLHGALREIAASDELPMVSVFQLRSIAQEALGE